MFGSLRSTPAFLQICTACTARHTWCKHHRWMRDRHLGRSHLGMSCCICGPALGSGAGHTPCTRHGRCTLCTHPCTFEGKTSAESHILHYIKRATTNVCVYIYIEHIHICNMQRCIVFKLGLVLGPAWPGAEASYLVGAIRPEAVRASSLPRKRV